MQSNQDLEIPMWKRYHVEGCTCRLVDVLPDGTILLGGIDDCPVHGFGTSSILLEDGLEKREKGRCGDGS
jgi:hypothetical protein